jgi:hypothetical protein
MRGEGPSNEPDATSDVHDRPQDVVARASGRARSIEFVDLALHALDGLEVSGEHRIGQ